MIKRKLKKITIPVIYGLALTVFTLSIYFIQKTFNKQTFESNV